MCTFLKYRCWATKVMIASNEPDLGMVALSYDRAAQEAPLAYGVSRTLVYLAGA